MLLAVRVDGKEWQEWNVAALNLAAVTAKSTGSLSPRVTAALPDGVYLESRCWLWRYSAYS